jgi:hypothetical protein
MIPVQSAAAPWCPPNHDGRNGIMDRDRLQALLGSCAQISKHFWNGSKLETGPGLWEREAS